jgi:hypothetical protein
MIKSLTALAIMSLLGTAVVALPMLAPQVKASEVAALTRSDRLPVRSVRRDCSQEVWPNFQTSCLRSSENGMNIGEARLISASR